MKYYLDSCIWRDYWEDRRDNMRPLGEFALNFLNKIIDNQDFVVVSNLVRKELSTRFSYEQIKEIFKIISDEYLLVDITYTESQVKEAALISKSRNVPFGDALNAILARDNNSILISRDRHYEELQDICLAKKPEDLL